MPKNLKVTWGQKEEKEEKEEKENNTEKETPDDGLDEELNRAQSYRKKLSEDEKPETKAKVEDDISWEDGNEEASKDKGQEGPSPKGTDKNLMSAQKEGTEIGKRSLDFILDIPLQITVELGRTKLLLNDLLQLGQGSIVELNKLAGEPMEVLVNDKLVAKGEVVVVNEKFGIRLTDIVSPMERIERLK